MSKNASPESRWGGFRTGKVRCRPVSLWTASFLFSPSTVSSEHDVGSKRLRALVNTKLEVSLRLMECYSWTWEQGCRPLHYVLMKL